MRVGLVLRSALTHLTVWATTLVLGILTILLSFLFPRRAVVWLGVLWGGAITKAAGVKVEVEGLENVPEGCAVLVANHTSNFDIYALMMVLRRTYYRFVVKKELLSIPIFGWALRAAGFPAVDRGDSRRAREAMQRLLARMRRTGMKAVVFPEGTRNAAPGMLPFKKGAFVLALQLQVPIVPVAISGARAVLPRHGFLVHPGVVRLSFLEPIPTAGRTVHERGAILEQAREAIRARLEAAGE